MLIKSISIRKTARYCVLGEPGPNTRHVWFACHGYGQLASDFITSFEPLDNGRNLVVAPEALHRFYLHGGDGKVGASWMTKEDRLNEIDDYIHYLDAVYSEIIESLDTKSVKITTLGFSQGTATACRWALGGRSRTQRLILWGGDIPPDTDWEKSREKLANLEFILVYGTKDPYVNQEQIPMQAERLKQLDVTVRIETFNGHHEIEPNMLKTLSQ
jgi:predicted esterase